MNATKPTQVIDRNGVLTTRHKKLDESSNAANRAHNIKVPQAAKNLDDATLTINRTLELADEAIQRRELVNAKIIASTNDKGELDLQDPELLEVVRVSQVASEIRNSIERLRELEVSEKDVQRYIGSAVGGSLDGVSFSDSDDVHTRTEKNALRNFYMAAFIALEGLTSDEKEDEYHVN